jgi:hypothetical protein
MPLLSLLLEFCLVATPYISRHFLTTSIIGIGYVITNITAAKTLGIAYPGLTYDNWESYVLLAFILAFIIFINVILTCISSIKLKKFGHNQKELTQHV